MFNWVYELSTGILLHGGPCEVEYDKATQGIIVLKENPSPVRHRVNEKGELREATKEEQDSFTVERGEKQVERGFSSQKDLVALVQYLSPKLGVTFEEAITDIIVLRKALENTRN